MIFSVKGVDMKRTKFYDIHKGLNAKLVDFAGFEMPVQYSSIIGEHMAVRNSVGVFDVSHMGEVRVTGEKALDFIQKITVNNAAKLVPGKVQYSAMCYEDAGIVDDLLVYKIAEKEYMLVINASNIEKDFDWMLQNKIDGMELNNESDDYSLLAIQGPNSTNVISKVFGKEIDLEYYTFTYDEFEGNEVILSRTGYTGEVGYELYFKGDEATAKRIWDAVFKIGKEYDIQPAGLGARDSLRLEMGFCLYGNDIDKTTNTLEAGLGWITKLKKGDFNGSSVLQKVKVEGLIRKLVPMTTDEKAFPRHGYEIAVGGEIVGHITSGTVSPVLNKPIALGYISKQFAIEGQQVEWVIRNKNIPAVIVKLPFIGK